MRCSFLLHLLVLVVLMICGVGGLKAENVLVVKKGDPFPAAGVDAAFDDFEPLALGTNGAVLFHASLTGTSVDGADEVIVLFESGSYQLVVQKGQPAPGFGDGEVISDLSEYGNLRGNNFMVFAGEISGTTVAAGTNSQIVWTGTVGGINVMARQGTVFASGTEQYTFSEVDFLTNDPFKHLATSNSGAVVFFTALKMTGTAPVASAQDDALLLFSGTKSLVLREFYSSLGGGNIVSGTSASNRLFSSLGFTGTSYSFIAQTSPVAPFSTNETSYVLSSTGGFFNVIATTGDGASKTQDGSIIQTVQGGAGNALGDFFYVAAMGTPNGGEAVKRKAMWYENLTLGSRLIARSGEDVPGLPSGVQYEDFGDPLVSATSALAFYAELSGSTVGNTNDAALICGSTNGVFSMIRRGDVWPPNPGDTLDDVLEIYAAGNGRVVVGAQSDSGALAVLKLEGGGTVASLHAVGDTVVTGSTDLGNSSELFFYESSSSQSGRKTFFNDNGQLLLGVKTNLTDKALVLLEAPVSAVPAPETRIQVVPDGDFVFGGNVDQKIKRGKTKSSTLKITNAGSTPGRFLLQGPLKSKKISFRYFDGDEEITDAVTSGRYIVGPLEPGIENSKTIRVDSKVAKAAQEGRKVTVRFVSSALLDGSVASTQKLRINIK